MIRVATPDDLEDIGRVMRLSTASLSEGFYDRVQIDSAVRFIAIPDRQLIDDGTYFVAHLEGSLAACGGWSARKKLFTGTTEQSTAESLLDPATDAARIRAMFVDPSFARRGLGRLILQASEEAARVAGFRTVELMATLPGLPLYLACGYEEVEQAILRLPDGAELRAVRMRRELPGCRVEDQAGQSPFAV